MGKSRYDGKGCLNGRVGDSPICYLKALFRFWPSLGCSFKGFNLQNFYVCQPSYSSHSG